MVSTPEEVTDNGKFSTLNFGMFKKLEFNRGQDNGIDVNRSQRFVKLFLDGQYFTDEIHVIVNREMETVDGHHHLDAHERLFEMGIELPINFTRTLEKAFNEGTQIKKAGGVARRNAINSKWDGMAHFNTALKFGIPLALEIQKLKAEAAYEYGIDKRMMSSSRIFSLLTSDLKRLNSDLVSVEEYDRPDLIAVLSTEKFKKEFGFVCKVINELNKWNEDYSESAKIIPFNMIRAVMPMVWGNMLNMDMFLAEIQTKRFANVSNTVKGCTTYAKKIQMKLFESMYK